MTSPSTAADPGPAPQPPARRLAMLERMLLIRAHALLLASTASPTAPGNCTAVGQEACAVGVVQALEPRDRIVSNHGSAGHLLARGAEPGRLMAELLGRADGCCGGKSGALHVSAAPLGVVLTSAIPGAGLSLASGVALAQTLGQQQQDGAGGITCVFFDDGAACEGLFHEALNLAVVWQLPLLFVCENNHRQAFVRRDQTMPLTHVAHVAQVVDWAQGHGIAAQVVDGNDVDAVFSAASAAVATIRADGRPQFLDLRTDQRRGHVEADDQADVDAAELAAARARDPIHLYQQRLLDAGVTSPAEINHVRQRVQTTIAAAQAFARHAPWPTPDALASDVYA